MTAEAATATVAARGDHADPGDRADRGGRRPAESAPRRPAGAASFEDAFEVELVQEFGDLGPAVAEPSERPERGWRRRPGWSPPPLSTIVPAVGCASLARRSG